MHISILYGIPVFENWLDKWLETFSYMMEVIFEKFLLYFPQTLQEIE